jgi:hypothetical protein
MKKETAVEWLLLKYVENSILSIDDFQQANKMFEQQIIDAWENGYQHGACVNEDKDKFHGVQYYNETFNNETTNND